MFLINLTFKGHHTSIFDSVWTEFRVHTARKIVTVSMELLYIFFIILAMILKHTTAVVLKRHVSKMKS